MSGQRAGLAEILLLLGTRPDASEVIEALVTGPLAEFGAHAGIISTTVGTDQVIVGDYGYPTEMVEPYRVMPNDGEYPMTRAFREQAVIISGALEVLPENPGLERDDDLWDRAIASEGYGALVTAPIVLQGRAIGAFGFSCVEERPWSTREIALLDAYGAALGLWLSHPGSTSASATAGGDITLTSRQVDILGMAASGKSNAAIAVTLDVSESTVKAELRRAYAALGVAARAAAVERATALGLLAL